MKVIAKEKDYYDFNSYYDNNIIYKREKKEGCFKDLFTENKLYYKFRFLENLNYLWQLNILGVAGNIYVIYNDWDRYYYKGFDKEFDLRIKEKMDNYIKVKYDEILINLNNLKELFFIFNIPIFMIENYYCKQYERYDLKYKFNINLKKVELNRIMKADELNQKIELFLANDLVKDKNVDFVGSDEIRAKAKGFNEYSFRPKAKHKPKKF